MTRGPHRAAPLRELNGVARGGTSAIATTVGTAANATSPPPPSPPPSDDRAGAHSQRGRAAHFATPCAISLVHDVVLNVTNAFQPNNAYATFQSINSGFYNHDFLFWPTVLSSSGAVVASGRRVAAAGVGLTYVPDHTNANFELSEATETDVTQTGVFGRIVAAANGDGYFTHLSRDLYAGHARTFRSRDEWSGHDAVHRVGFVRRIVATGGQVYYVLCSFTDLPNGEPDALQPCSPSNDGLCALAYTRKVLGVVTSMMLKAADEAALQLLLGRVTWRDFNEQGAPGFYPFIYKLDSTCVAHGANPTNVGRRLPDIIAGVPRLANPASPTSTASSSPRLPRAAGGWATIGRTARPSRPTSRSHTLWACAASGRPITLASASTTRRMRAQGLHCEACRQDYNYPCAWANVLGLVGHAQSLMFIDNVYGLSTAFQKLTYESAYGGGGRTAGRAARSADWLYVFMFRFDGTCVAHARGATLSAGRFRTSSRAPRASAASSPVQRCTRALSTRPTRAARGCPTRGRTRPASPSTTRSHTLSRSCAAARITISASASPTTSGQRWAPSRRAAASRAGLTAALRPQAPVRGGLGAPRRRPGHARHPDGVVVQSARGVASCPAAGGRLAIRLPIPRTTTKSSWAKATSRATLGGRRAIGFRRSSSTAPTSPAAARRAFGFRAAPRVPST